jgi:hypothetical protein
MQRVEVSNGTERTRKRLEVSISAAAEATNGSKPFLDQVFRNLDTLLRGEEIPGTTESNISTRVGNGDILVITPKGKMNPNIISALSLEELIKRSSAILIKGSSLIFESVRDGDKEVYRGSLNLIGLGAEGLQPIGKFKPEESAAVVLEAVFDFMCGLYI